MLILIGALGMVLKGLRKRQEELEIRGNNQNYPDYNSVEISEHQEESWRPKETCCHSDSSKRPLAKDGMKNLQGVKE